MPPWIGDASVTTQATPPTPPPIPCGSRRSHRIALLGLLFYLCSTLLRLPDLLARHTVTVVFLKQLLVYAVHGFCLAVLALLVSLCMRSLRTYWWRAFATFVVVCGAIELAGAVVQQCIIRPAAEQLLEKYRSQRAPESRQLRHASPVQ